MVVQVQNLTNGGWRKFGVKGNLFAALNANDNEFSFARFHYSMEREGRGR